MESSFFNVVKKEQPSRDEKSEQLLSLLAPSPELADLLLAFASRLNTGVSG